MPRVEPDTDHGSYPKVAMARRLPELILAAIGLIVFILGYITDNGSTLSAILMLAGVCVLSFSIMFYFFSPRRELRSEVYEAASIPSALAIVDVLSAIHIESNGVYVPASRTGRSRVFLPISDNDFGSISVISGQVGKVVAGPSGSSGIYITPPGEGLLEYARSIGANFYPDGLEKVVQDLLVNGTELATRAHIRRDGDRVTVTMYNIAYKEMCNAIRRKNPSLCLWIGCPVCSFAGCMVAESANMNARVDGVDVHGDEVKVTYKLS